MKAQYFKYEGTRGKRFFKVFLDKNLPVKTVQVVLHPGSPKIGRANVVGVYKCAYSTITNSYALLDGFKEANANEYNKAFNSVMDNLCATPKR